MSDSLRSLIHQSTEIVSQLVEGELTPEMEKTLTEIDLKLPAAVDAASVLVERLEHEADYWKNKAIMYSEISKRIDANREKILESIKAGMQQLQLTDLEGKDVRFKLSKAKPRLVLREEFIDDSYKNTVTEIVVDKAAIRKDLENGVDVDGAMLVDSFSLRTYANIKGKK